MASWDAIPLDSLILTDRLNNPRADLGPEDDEVLFTVRRYRIEVPQVAHGE